MKLLTKDLREKLPALYATENQSEDEKQVVCKFFDPCGRGTWFVIEFDGEDTLFCWCKSPLGEDCDELGYASLSELASVRNRSGLGIERDLHWTPCSLAEAKRAG